MKAEMLDKLRSPFYVSLLVSFILWNWRAVVIMVSPYADVDLAERFRWIEAYYPTFPWIRTILMPILSASVAVAGLPWFINRLEDFRHAAYVQRQNNKKERDAKLLNVQRQISELNGIIQEVRNQNNILKNEKEQLQLKLDDDASLSKGLMRSYLATASIAVTSDRQVHTLVRELVLSIGNVPLGSEMGTKLMTYGIVEQNEQQGYNLTPQGHELVRYIKEHVPVPG